MKILSRMMYSVILVLMLFSFTQAQVIDTSRSTGTGTGTSGTTGTGTGTGNTGTGIGTGNTGTGTGVGNTGDNTGSMGRTGTGTDHTGLGVDTSRTGTGGMGTGTGNTGTGTGTGMGTGTGNTGTGTGNTGTGMGTGTGTGGMGTGTGTGNTGDVTGGSRSGMGTSATMIRSSLEEASSRFMQAINNGDINTAVTFYTNDATLLPPDLDIIQGSTGISNFWTKITSMGLKFDTLTTADVRPSEDGQQADEVGRYFLKIERPGQAPVSEKGKFLFVWKRQPDNSWKIDTHMWNRSRQ